MTDTLGQRFRPGLWATLLTVPALVVLVGLGTWQIHRMDWKDALIAERQARGAAPAVVLPREIPEPAALEFRRVRLTGRFLHDREMYLGARPRDGRPGFGVVTPMLLDDGRGILVHRGWVPVGRQDPASRPEGQVAGSLSPEAVLRTGGWKGARMFRPENQPEKNLWLWIDPPAMAAHAGLADPVTAVYAEAGPQPNPGGLPIGREVRVDLPNDHLQYALTWYALAVVLLVIYILYHARPGR